MKIKNYIGSMFFILVINIVSAQVIPNHTIGIYNFRSSTTYDKHNMGTGVNWYREDNSWCADYTVSFPFANRTERWSPNPILLSQTYRSENYNSSDLRTLSFAYFQTFYLAPVVPRYTTTFYGGEPVIPIQLKNEVSYVIAPDGFPNTFSRDAKANHFVRLFGGFPANSFWNVTINIKAYHQFDTWNFWNDGNGPEIIPRTKIRIKGYPCDYDGNVTLVISNNSLVNPTILNINVDGEHNIRFDSPRVVNITPIKVDKTYLL